METDGFYIDKITVGDKDLREGWNVDYFSAIVEEDIYSRAEGPHL
jgi:hypothetical protein